MPPMKRPTIDDVAAFSGVARVTVSRVLNGGPNVRPEVRERVRRAVETLGYKVNPQARFLAGGAARQLTLVHESVLDAEPNSYYHSALELGAMRGCVQRGFALSTLGLDPNDKGYIRRLLDLVESGQSDGLLLTPPFSDDVELVQSLVRRESPVVCIAGGPAIRAVTAAIGVDDEAAGFEIGRYIIGLGHRKLGYINGPERHVSATYRLKGLMRAVTDADVGVEVIAENGDFTFRSGVFLAERLLAARGDITALVCANDDMAAGAMLTAHRRGLAIPGHLSISGFDDTPVSEIIWPPLTTIHQPIRLIGRQAVELLVDAIEAGRGAAEAGFRTVPFKVVERASTGPVRL